MDFVKWAVPENRKHDLNDPAPGLAEILAGFRLLVVTAVKSEGRYCVSLESESFVKFWVVAAQLTRRRSDKVISHEKKGTKFPLREL